MSPFKHIKALLLRLLTYKKSNEFDLKRTSNILYLRYDRIGDMVITTPVFRELKLAYPDIKITVLASKANKDVLLNNPYVNQIYTNHKNNFLTDLPILFKLRKIRFDVCVEFDHSVIPHAILRLRIIKPKIAVSVNKEGRYGVKGKELKLYDYYTEKPKGAHFRDIWLNTLRPFSITPRSSCYDLFPSENQTEIAKNFVQKFQNKLLIGINLEGAVKGKKIQFSELKGICNGLYQRNSNIQIIILSTPNNHEIIEKKVTNLKLNYVVTSYKTHSILDVAALINHLDLVITPDTSIVHIASAFNRPIISIHENNLDSYKLFAPTSKYSRTVFSKYSNKLDGYNVDSLIKKSLSLLANEN